MDAEPAWFEEVELDREVEIGRHTPTRDEIVEFAQRWDPQPFHVDEEAADLQEHGLGAAIQLPAQILQDELLAAEEEESRDVLPLPAGGNVEEGVEHARHLGLSPRGHGGHAAAHSLGQGVEHLLALTKKKTVNGWMRNDRLIEPHAPRESRLASCLRRRPSLRGC